MLANIGDIRIIQILVITRMFASRNLEAAYVMILQWQDIASSL